MNEDILGLLGVDVKGAKEKAFTRGLLSTIFNAAALSGPQARPVSNVQALGQLGLGAMEAYDTSFDRTLKEAMTGLQLKDIVEKRKRQQQLQALTPQLFQQTRAPATEIPTELGATGDLGTYTPVMEPGRVTGVEVNRQMLPVLGALGPEGMDYASKLMAFQKSMQPEERVMKPGEVLYSGGKEVLRVPENDPSEIRSYTIAVQRGLVPPGTTLTEYRKSGASSLVMPGEGERKSAVLANRIQFNVNQISDILGKKPEAAGPEALPTAIKAITGSDYLKSLTNTQERQRIEAAQLDILDAALTLGTGAAYTREQLESYRTSYFPQLGDKPETIKDKQDRLQNLLESAYIASGRAAPTIGKKPEAAQQSIMRQQPSALNPDLNALIEAARREKANRSK
jgi:hypothetical protein